MRRPPMIIYPITGWAVPPNAAGRPRKTDVAGAPTASKGSGRASAISGGVSGRTFLLVLIISVVMMVVAIADRQRLVNEGASASSPRRMRRLRDAVAGVSWSWRGGVDRGPLQVVAEVEVGGESVSQILGGEIVQRRSGPSCPFCRMQACRSR
jgi:hypothetical protein